MTKFLTAFLLASVLLHPISGGTLITPWNSAPAMVQVNDTFSILYKGAASEQPDSAVLVGPFNRIALGIEASVPGKTIYDSYTKDSITLCITVRIPADAPDEIYNLVLYTNLDTITAEKAVKTVRAFNKRITFIHISDTHITSAWDSVLHYAQELQYTSHIVAAANIIGPDFVICTGDDIMDYNQPPSLQEKWDQFFHGGNGYPGMHALTSPLFLTPGNHDLFHAIYPLQRAMQWNQYCGTRYYALRYGGLRLFAYDSDLGADFPDSQRTYFESWLQRAGPGSFRMVAQHNPGKKDTLFWNSAKIKLALFGHTHINSSFTEGTTPTQCYQTASAGHFAYVGASNVGWMRVITINDSQVLANSLFQYGNTTTQTDLLTLTFAKPNNGSSTANTATLVNNLGAAFPQGRIRFIMAKGSYAVDKGILDQVIENDSLTVCDVRLPLASRSTNVVNINPVDKIESALSPFSLGRLTFHPNPFSSAVRLTFSLEKESPVTLQIISAQGKQVYQRHWPLLQKGLGQLLWNGTNAEGRKAAQGCYVVRLQFKDKNDCARTMAAPLMVLK